jgi:hypothetical protein
MTIKVGESTQIIKSIDELLEKEMSASLALQLTRIKTIVKKEEELFVEQQRALFTKYGELMDGDQMQIKKENINVFRDEVNKLYLTEVELNANKIKLTDIDDLKPKGKTIEAILMFLEE